MARYEASFLVRIWTESGLDADARPPEWRGSVVHLMSQERRYFTEIVDLAAFLTAHTRDSEAGQGDSERPDA